MDTLDSYASSDGSDEPLAPVDGVVEPVGETSSTAATHDQEHATAQVPLQGQDTKAGVRIAELDEVEQRIAQLLHLAGCTLASLHPEPLSSFTSRTISVEEDSDDEGEDTEDNSQVKPAKATSAPLNAEEQKGADFAKYAEAYYETLNDIQLSLRTSIRHLRISRASPAPILDPHFASLANPTSVGSIVKGGGAALGAQLDPTSLQPASWPPVRTAHAPQAPKLSVGAMELEYEAWRDLADSLGK